MAHFLRRVTALVVARRPRNILEIGCREGDVLRALRDAGISCPMLGVDTSETAVAAARQRVPDATFQVADAQTLLAAGERYDVVLMLDELDQVADPEGMLSLLSQLAERHLVLSVPWQPFFRGFDLALGQRLRAPDPIHHWGRRELERLVGEHFVIQDAPYVFPWTLVGAAVPQ